ncbi:hypothetical protein [Microbacterium sp. CSI-V]|uniref:hypothetical protein n=1 Tax=Microbacterium sp. CSI-V TaxID=1933777 RepID=UPI001115A275|nr:hypothetical protein [Microbacterium sp. CSI-V]
MAGWVLVAVAAGAVAIGCAVVLLVVGMVGARRRVSSGPVVVAGRVLFSALLLAVLVAVIAGLGAAISGAVAAIV